MKKMVIFAMIFVLAGCGVARTSDKALLAELEKLPADVPVYPNGQIESLDRDSFRVETGTYTLAQGVLIFDDQMPKVAGWYKSELEKQGWEIINLRDELIVSLKNGVHFQLIFKDDDGKTEVIYFMNPAR